MLYFVVVVKLSLSVRKVKGLRKYFSGQNTRQLEAGLALKAWAELLAGFGFSPFSDVESLVN